MNKKINLSALSMITAFGLSNGILAAEQTRVALNPLLANVISGNLGNGVSIINSSDSNTVAGNVIGTDLLGRRDLGNSGYGVYIANTSDSNLIGGTTLTAGNLIAYNQKGVVVGDSALDLSVGNSILSNSNYNNT